MTKIYSQSMLYFLLVLGLVLPHLASAQASGVNQATNSHEIPFNIEKDKTVPPPRSAIPAGTYTIDNGPELATLKFNKCVIPKSLIGNILVELRTTNTQGTQAIPLPTNIFFPPFNDTKAVVLIQADIPASIPPLDPQGGLLVEVVVTLFPGLESCKDSEPLGKIVTITYTAI